MSLFNSHLNNCSKKKIEYILKTDNIVFEFSLTLNVFLRKLHINHIDEIFRINVLKNETIFDFFFHLLLFDTFALAFLIDVAFK